MTEIGILVSVIFIFSIVQSIFGVGLLVFGTPTLLILGYSFETTLSLLLPASFTISLMQILQGKQYIGTLKRDLAVYTVPTVILGLALVLTGFFTVDMKTIVGIMLLASAIIRLSNRIQALLARFLARNLKVYLLVMGLVHGLSNMGGGLLTILMSAIYSEKDRIRANIALGYLIFAGFQIGTLLALNPGVFTSMSLVLAGISFLVFQTFGNFIFQRSPKAVYQRMITFFIFTYGVVLIFQKFL